MLQDRAASTTSPTAAGTRRRRSLWYEQDAEAWTSCSPSPRTRCRRPRRPTPTCTSSSTPAAATCWPSSSCRRKPPMGRDREHARRGCSTSRSRSTDRATLLEYQGASRGQRRRGARRHRPRRRSTRSTSSTRTATASNSRARIPTRPTMLQQARRGEVGHARGVVAGPSARRKHAAFLHEREFQRSERRDARRHPRPGAAQAGSTSANAPDMRLPDPEPAVRPLPRGGRHGLAHRRRDRRPGARPAPRRPDRQRTT